MNLGPSGQSDILQMTPAPTRKTQLSQNPYLTTSEMAQRLLNHILV